MSELIRSEFVAPEVGETVTVHDTDWRGDYTIPAKRVDYKERPNVKAFYCHRTKTYRRFVDDEGDNISILDSVEWSKL